MVYKKNRSAANTPEGFSALLAVQTETEALTPIRVNILAVADDIGTVDVAVCLFA